MTSAATLRRRRVVREPTQADRGERRGARELSPVAPGTDGAAELRRVGGGEEGVLEVARGFVVLLVEVGAIPEIVLARGELDLIGAGGSGRGCGGGAGVGAGAAARAGAGAGVDAGVGSGSGAAAWATVDHVATQIASTRGGATHGKSVPGPACPVNLLVGHHSWTTAITPVREGGFRASRGTR